MTDLGLEKMRIYDDLGPVARLQARVIEDFQKVSSGEKVGYEAVEDLLNRRLIRYAETGFDTTETGAKLLAIYPIGGVI